MKAQRALIILISLATSTCATILGSPSMGADFGIHSGQCSNSGRSQTTRNSLSPAYCTGYGARSAAITTNSATSVPSSQQRGGRYHSFAVVPGAAYLYSPTLVHGTHSSTFAQPLNSPPPGDYAGALQKLNNDLAQSRMNYAVQHLQQVYDSNKDSLQPAERSEFIAKFSQLQQQAPSEESIDSIEQITRSLEAEIIDKTMFSSSLLQETSASTPQFTPSAPLIEPVSLSPEPVFIATPPPASFDKSLSKTESRLLELHQVQAIGSFDMDRFSHRLGIIKQSWKALAQDAAIEDKSRLQEQLRKLDRDIASRTQSF